MSFRRIFVSCALVVSLGACTLIGRESHRIAVSPDTARMLLRVSGHLRAADAEMQISCASTTSCAIEIDGSRQPKIDAEVIQHPFENRPLALRVHGGTQELQGALYEALGELAPTNDFQGRLDERVIHVENKKLEISCVSTRGSRPVFECWTIVSADILR